MDDEQCFDEIILRTFVRREKRGDQSTRFLEVIAPRRNEYRIRDHHAHWSSCERFL